MFPAFKRLSFDSGARSLVIASSLLGAGVFVAARDGFFPHYMPLPEMAAASVAGDGQTQIFVQVRETTIAEWNRCYDDGGCQMQLRAPEDAEQQDYPATGINWIDAQEYIRWLSKASGHPFRLPTSGEWYQMAHDVLPDTPDPIFSDPSLTWASAYLLEEGVDRKLRPSGAWSITADGLVDLDGNVWEWTQDCYNGATETSLEAPCAAYALGGEHRAVVSFLVRDPARGGCAVGAPPAHIGLRPVTDRDPS